MTSQAEVASKIIATLGITEPDLDTAVGSVTRKIIDAVSQQIADSYVDDHLLTYQYDIDSKIESDLDDFVQLFGMSRIAAKRATGVVTFFRGTGDTSEGIQISVNSQIGSTSITSGGITVAQTVTPGYIAIGQTSVEVPVIAVVPGVQGNIAAGLLTRALTPIEGVLGITNVQPLSGGIGQESDSELRARWKRTVFRSLAGTEAMYLGIALNHENCFGANVLGATKTQTEQVQINTPPTGSPASWKGVGYSSRDDVRFAYPESAVLGPYLVGSQVLLRDYDYFFDTSVRPPRVVMLQSAYATGFDTESGPEVAAVQGAVFDLTYEYAPEASRNEPAAGITNRVDVWCAGVNAKTAVQTVVFSSQRRFVTDFGSPYCVYNYRRADQTNPNPQNIFVPLAFGPILTLPTTLSVSQKTYKINEDYWLVHDDTAEGYAVNSRYGIEWKASSEPTGINPIMIVGLNEQYSYNAMVEEVQAGIDRWRLTGIDAQAHQAKLQQLRFNIAVMYDRQADPDITNGQIELALQKYCQSLSFGGTVQVSDALQAVHNAPGVDNVRFLDARDWKNYDPNTPNAFGVGIQRVVRDAGDVPRVVESYVKGAAAEPRDVSFGDAEVPVFESFRGDRIDESTGRQRVNVPAIRAQNTFYAGVEAPAPLPAPAPAPGTGTPPPNTSGSTGTPGAANTPDFTLTGLQDGNSLSLNWTAQAAAAGYEVFRDDVRIAGLGPANGTPTTNTFTTVAAIGVRVYQIKTYIEFNSQTGAVTHATSSNTLTFDSATAGGTGTTP